MARKLSFVRSRDSPWHGLRFSGAFPQSKGQDGGVQSNIRLLLFLRLNKLMLTCRPQAGGTSKTPANTPCLHTLPHSSCLLLLWTAIHPCFNFHTLLDDDLTLLAMLLIVLYIGWFTDHFILLVYGLTVVVCRLGVFLSAQRQCWGTSIRQNYNWHPPLLRL
jgi:hypothetical protein